MVIPLAARPSTACRPDPRFIADLRQQLLTATRPTRVVAGEGRTPRPPDSAVAGGPALAVSVVGAGPPVVLLHGLAGSHRFWRPVARRLARGHRVIVPDLLGFGASPRPPGGYGPDDHVAAVAECALRAGLSGPALVAGHSAGAVIALRLAVLRPDLVAAVACFGPPIYPTRADGRRRLRRIGLLARLVGVDSRLAEAACQFACQRHTAAAARVFSAVRRDLPPEVAADAVHHSWASYSETLNKVVLAAESDSWLASVDVPILLITGRQDRVVDIGHLAELERMHPHVSVEVWGRAGHTIPLTHPRACAAAIVRGSPEQSLPPGVRGRAHVDG
jgi:pimeloyl-ACP methyl ester carboxylesterase